MISKQRPQTIEEVEALLLVLINEKQLKRDSLSEAFICEKALDIYGELVKKTLGANSKDFDFKASRRWFEKLKQDAEFTEYLNMEMRQVQARKRQRGFINNSVTS